MNNKTESYPTIKKQWFIQSSNQSIFNKYSFGKKLGQGAYGEVFKASLIGTDMIRAIKIISKNAVSQPIRLINEINFMKQLDHPNLVKLYETFETGANLFLVMEYCEGGELLDKLSNGKGLSEKQLKPIFRDMVRAINYLHSKNICHRDLKPQNFLLLDNTKNSIVKLTDFGLSAITQNSKKKMKSLVGTIYYISPEVLDKDYDISCDIWSLGIILIVLLTGQIPIFGRDDCQILSNIKVKQIIIPKNISTTARNLIKKCLDSPNKRIKASQILDHPWLIDQVKTTNKHQLNLQRMEQFTIKSHMKKIVLTIIASQVKSSDIEDLTNLYKYFDTNNDGVLSHEQILNAFQRNKKIKKSPKDLRKIIEGIDTDKNGHISYTQFLAAMMEQKVYLKPNYLKLAFSIIDKDSNGTIELQELKQLLLQGQNNSDKPKLKDELEEYEQQWENIMKKLDKNKDGKIQFDQFIKLFQS